MKIIYSIFIALVLTANVANAVLNEQSKKSDPKNNPKTVDDYFLIIPEYAFLGLQNPSVDTETNRRDYLNMSHQKDGNVKISYNKDKTFMSLLDHTTAFEAKYEIVVLPLTNNTKLVVVVSNMKHEEGSANMISFLEYNGQDWENVAKKVLPNMGCRIFSDDANSDITEEDNSVIMVNSVKCSLKNDGHSIEMSIKEGMNMFLIDQKDVPKYENFFKKVMYSKIVLVWNSKKGLYEIKEKIKK